MYSCAFGCLLDSVKQRHDTAIVFTPFFRISITSRMFTVMSSRFVNDDITAK